MLFHYSSDELLRHAIAPRRGGVSRGRI